MTPINLPYLNVRTHRKRGRSYVYAVYRRNGQVRPIVDETSASATRNAESYQ